MINIYKVLVGKPKQKRPLERPRCRREVLRETDWEVVEGIHLAQDRDQWPAFVTMVTKFRVP
jgi:hypothetical protein